MLSLLLAEIRGLIQDALATVMAVLRSPWKATTFQPADGIAFDATGARDVYGYEVLVKKAPAGRPTDKELPLRFVLLLGLFFALTLAFGAVYVALALFLTPLCRQECGHAFARLARGRHYGSTSRGLECAPYCLPIIAAF
ncbi:MAG: hypothetical protein KGJ78_11150 [Alphaproteobacteria bacterium]|nr:hypothetical protein [Alphaproteobacteria bacterium]